MNVESQVLEYFNEMLLQKKRDSQNGQITALTRGQQYLHPKEANKEAD